MLADNLQDRATLYASGEMTAPDREAFEVLMEYHGELRALVAGLQEIVSLAMAAPAAAVAPSVPAGLKSRILGHLPPPLPPPEPEALVVANAGGLLEWVNPAFTAMCGYTLEELSGRKPGQILQGPLTDPASVHRIRDALRARRACRETMVNYHKDGTVYRADVRILPVLDDAGEVLWFVAKERRLSDLG
jgi:PAS domain S-box-containing protein